MGPGMKLATWDDEVSYSTSDVTSGQNMNLAVAELVLNHLWGSKSISIAHTVGFTILRTDKRLKKIPSTILCDTGAVACNYIDRDYHKQLLPYLNKRDTITEETITLLADKKTECISPGRVKLTLCMYDEWAKKKIYRSEFKILESLSCDIILGLPALVGTLKDFFISKLEEAAAHYAKTNSTFKTELIPHGDKSSQDERTKNPDKDFSYYWPEEETPEDEIWQEMLCNIANYSGKKYLDPWTAPPEDQAPEDMETPMPTQFGEVVAFLSKPREEAINEYRELMKTNISQEFKDSTDVVTLLTEKYLDIFVPRDWRGISGVPPLKLEWLDDLPPKLKARARPINPRLYESSQKEFSRLLGYMYRPSRSPWASCLVVAPKATKPYIRFCGDYVTINKFMKVGHYPIPIPKHEIHKILGFKIFLDIDMTNAFHQIKLHKETSERLSIQTPWGQYEPVYMPEGIAPATGLLQETVHQMFSDFAEWSIVIFDNMLLLAHDYEDAYKKLDIFLNRCRERNVILKMAKSKLGFKEVKFFGYTCRHNNFEVSKDKIAAFEDLPTPTTIKQARSALGMGVMFATFIPHYSTIAAPISDMTKKDFDWDKKNWKVDYDQAFRVWVEAIKEATQVFFPDYTLPWILRTDASLEGAAAVLLQVPPDDQPLQPIGIVSKKFSAQAKNWTTIEQEAYGNYFGVNAFEYLLMGKEFILETDHNNLRWIEASLVPKIIRWRIYMQGFNFKVHHIAGKLNCVSDWFSRNFKQDATAANDVLACMLLALEDHDRAVNEERAANTVEDCFKQVHNAKVGHLGSRRTWHRFNTWFEGHKVPFNTIVDMVGECPVCQKPRLGMDNSIKPIVRHMKPPNARSTIGIDALEISPKGEQGETHIIVCVNLFTKHTYLQKVCGDTAKNLATVVWQYWCNFGYTDSVISDKGPDLRSDLFKQLTQLAGLRHSFSIANRHANGCERVLKEVQRHLRVLATESNCRNIFKDPTWIPSAQMILNSEVSSETDATPFALTFGTVAAEQGMIQPMDLTEAQHPYLQKLNNNLRELQDISRKYQDQLNEERLGKGPTADTQNQFQAGDLVLFDTGEKPHPKMATRFAGPFQVIKQNTNKVLAKDLHDDTEETYHVETLKLFAGDKDTAEDLALLDKEQHKVTAVEGYLGEPTHRTSLKFLLRYEDNEVGPKSYDKDLTTLQHYKDYCADRPHLFQLTMTSTEANKWKAKLNKMAITNIAPKDNIYVDLRWYGDLWFQSLELPNQHTITYVLPFKCIAWASNKKTKIMVENTCPGFNSDQFTWNHYEAYAWGHIHTLDDKHHLITQDFLNQFPDILPEKEKEGKKG